MILFSDFVIGLAYATFMHEPTSVFKANIAEWDMTPTIAWNIPGIMAIGYYRAYCDRCKMAHKLVYG